MFRGYLIKIVLATALMVLISATYAQPAVKTAQFPDPSVRDQITHDRGNIATTVQNYGYIGGFSWAGRPSGRWPANSDHDYLAEMRFWVGGKDALDNVYLSNTYDDFNPIPTLSSLEYPTDILLSTDTTRYDYDANDTVGTGVGFPANGWRVWDAVNDQWVYNQVYSAIDSTFYQGGPIGVQESICRYGDDATGPPVMGLEITQTVRQWNYSYNRDMIFITLDIKNGSLQDYHDFAVGLYCDFDIGGPDPATGENGRLGDLVAFDSALSLAWTYDEDGYDPGWGPSTVTGLMGTVILETPNDIGMTSFNTGQWELLPDNDADRYDLIDNTEFDTSLPPTDQYYVQSVRGITLPADSVVRFSFALVAGPNEEYLKQNAQRARTLYDAYYVGAQPPDAPIVKTLVGDRKVTLYWDRTSENAIEPTTGQKDFGGYKVYRSTNFGQTWGTIVTNPDLSTGPDYYPIARFIPDVFGRVSHVLVDSNLTNGMEYWYSVVAYDTGFSDGSYDTLQNDQGSPESAENTVSVIPVDDPLGFVSAQADMTHNYGGTWRSSGDYVDAMVLDENNISSDVYQVTFDENCLTTYWWLVNTTTGDTLIADSLVPGETINQYPEFDGVQIAVSQPLGIYPAQAMQTIIATGSTPTLAESFVEKFYPDYVCHDMFRNDVEIRFTAGGSTAYEWFTGNPVTVPYEVWDVTNNIQLGSWFADFYGDGNYTLVDEDYIILTNFDYDNGNPHFEAYPDYFTWIMAFDVSSAPQVGDVYTIEGPDVLSPDDVFEFTPGKHTINVTEASQSLDRIRVVPNPYYGYAKWETDGIPKLQFVNLPEECTIRIYTLAGDLIDVLEHNGTGAENWNMASEAGRGIASGMYIFHVESTVGDFTGKFAVIK